MRNLATGFVAVAGSLLITACGEEVLPGSSEQLLEDPPAILNEPVRSMNHDRYLFANESRACEDLVPEKFHECVADKVGDGRLMSLDGIVQYTWNVPEEDLYIVVISGKGGYFTKTGFDCPPEEAVCSRLKDDDEVHYVGRTSVSYSPQHGQRVASLEFVSIKITG